MTELDALREKISSLVRDYARRAHRKSRPGADPDREPFVPGKDSVPYAGRVFTEDEVEAAVAASLDFWLTFGKHGAAMEQELANWLGVRESLLVNSGSSANLIAMRTLTSPHIEAERRLLPGDEVITCAAGFPTTVAAIVQTGCVPVFVDNDPVTGNIDASQLKAAFRPGKTKAVMVAHALGNPFDVRSVLEFCRARSLWLIEDNCDALGSTYTMPKQTAYALGIRANSPGLDAGPHAIIRFTGTWGDVSTQSFYPSHHITLGEGGALNIVSSSKLRRIAESIRDWGRDCWCPTGQDNLCGRQFDWQLGELPPGYDHKYTYSHLGYNLRPLDLQAAIGLVQLKRLSEFVRARQRNWEYLRRGLEELTEYFTFSLPTHAVGWRRSTGFDWDDSRCTTGCSWFGFLLLVRPEAPFGRSELARYLNGYRIENRMLFGGNLIKQPAFVGLRRERPDALRVVGGLPGADRLMERAIFLGTYPGLTEDMMAYEIDAIKRFVKARS